MDVHVQYSGVYINAASEFIRSELSIRKSTTMIGRRQLMDHRLVNTKNFIKEDHKYKIDGGGGGIN
ncbi:hypothetical protein DERF_009877 [Dermatophagoides farinae]|uniref:Uncharacterized protein n=1 Tax=Dermatophagoides farinae TaxID=6954 RepID=A0A922HY59_DERFA|nr:hypothetical protein DERF_009877 [Dermatophagoides farinae]